jgi:hypothetical protein
MKKVSLFVAGVVLSGLISISIFYPAKADKGHSQQLSPQQVEIYISGVIGIKDQKVRVVLMAGILSFFGKLRVPGWKDSDDIKRYVSNPRNWRAIEAKYILFVLDRRTD